MRLLLLTFLTVFISCRSQTAGQYFNRPKLEQAINSDCYGFSNGKKVNTTNWISTPPDLYPDIRDYYDSREFCNYVCIKYPKKCKACR